MKVFSVFFDDGSNSSFATPTAPGHVTAVGAGSRWLKTISVPSMVSVTFLALGSSASGVTWKLTAGVAPPAKKASRISAAYWNCCSTEAEMPRSTSFTVFQLQGRDRVSTYWNRFSLKKLSIMPFGAKSLAKSAIPISAREPRVKG